MRRGYSCSKAVVKDGANKRMRRIRVSSEGGVISVSPVRTCWSNTGWTKPGHRAAEIYASSSGSCVNGAQVLYSIAAKCSYNGSSAGLYARLSAWECDAVRKDAFSLSSVASIEALLELQGDDDKQTHNFTLFRKYLRVNVERIGCCSKRRTDVFPRHTRDEDRRHWQPSLIERYQVAQKRREKQEKRK